MIFFRENYFTLFSTWLIIQFKITMYYLNIRRLYEFCRIYQFENGNLLSLS